MIVPGTEIILTQILQTLHQLTASARVCMRRKLKWFHLPKPMGVRDVARTREFFKQVIQSSFSARRSP